MPIQITEKNWLNYLRALEKINEGAAEKVTDYLSEHEILSEEGRKNFLDYFYAIVTKYGEGSAEMACQMYDATAKAQGANVPPAEPAPTATYPETARAVNGSLFDSPSGAKLPGTAKRLVKQAGVDTTMKNAIRDGAEWAWVPHGDTCAFCLMLASNGWQRASKKALKNSHAQHIHGNCDCTYAVRFDGKSGVKGYDPNEYKALYDNAEGDNWREKMNSMRREHYAENKERINEQKRIEHAERSKAAMAAEEEIIVWPTDGQRVDKQAFKTIREYADKKNIVLAGVKNSNVSLEIVKDNIDRVSELLEKYRLAEMLEYPFTIDYSHSLRANDFAETFPGTGHILYMNKDACRNKEALAKEYKKLVDKRFFVDGTDYRAIPYHEMGHIIADVYSIDPKDIAMRVSGTKNTVELMEFVGKNLSIYATKDLDGSEIIAECFASVYGGGKSEFALKFVEECDKIILQGGGQ